MLPQSIFNASYKRVGGLHFLALGRFRFSFCIARRQDVIWVYDPDSAFRERPLTQAEHATLDAQLAHLGISR